MRFMTDIWLLCAILTRLVENYVENRIKFSKNQTENEIIFI